MHTYAQGVRLALITAAGYTAVVLSIGMALAFRTDRIGDWPVFLTFAAGLGLLVLAAAVLVQVPALLVVRGRLSAAWMAVAGAVLAFVPFTVLLGITRDGGDPVTLGGYVAFWLQVPAEFLFSFVPMLLAGGVLGYLVGTRVSATASAR